MKRKNDTGYKFNMPLYNKRDIDVFVQLFTSKISTIDKGVIQYLELISTHTTPTETKLIMKSKSRLYKTTYFREIQNKIDSDSINPRTYGIENWNEVLMYMNKRLSRDGSLPTVTFKFSQHE